MNKKKCLLLILDGWGCREKATDNAISTASTPQWDKWQKTSCITSLKASEEAVGLPVNQMGNSEVGHMHIGSGRIIKQNLALITDDINQGSFHKNQALIESLQAAKKRAKSVHLIGLVSKGGVHSHQSHLDALLDVLQREKIENSFVHAILDGRDCAPTDGLKSIKALSNKLKKSATKLATLCGRFYAMDRDKRWDRTQQYYQLLTQPPSKKIVAPLKHIEQSYIDNEFDEFIKPAALDAHQIINEGDLVIFFNFRADRARQLYNAFSDRNFTGFDKKNSLNVHTLTVTEFISNQTTPCMYPTKIPKNTLGECLEKNNLRQLRIAETEKYAHVTFFLNGGREAPFNLEDRTLINSPKVRTYDLQPEMSAFELTDKLILALNSEDYSLIICNYANADMLGHTGNFNAAVKSIEVLDECLAKISKVIDASNTSLIITADHGNAEKMYDETNNQAHTAHTLAPVPFIFINKDNNMKIQNNHGSLIDLAPTILSILDLKIPSEMTGTPLISAIDNT